MKSKINIITTIFIQTKTASLYYLTELSYIFQDIEDLKFRLKNTRHPKPGLEGAGWTYGVPGQALPKIIDYWLNKYNFKSREVYVNKYPQFKTNIQGK